MEIIRVIPQGYCQGVVRAIQIVKKTIAENPDRPIAMLGMIVHNQAVVEACSQHGVHILDHPHKTRLELLDDVHEGIVIFTAHGVSDAVYEKAERKGLQIVDATCPDVRRTHDLIRRHCQHGDVLYIGKQFHPEAEGVCGISPRVHLIADAHDLSSCTHLHHPLITTQTTLSQLDAAALISLCKKQHPEATIAKEICPATTIRQNAILKLKNVDLLLVVGDPRSNNSRQLCEIGKAAGIPDSMLIENALQLKKEIIFAHQRIAVTSGSSTPPPLSEQVWTVLEKYAKDGIWQLPKCLPSIF